MRDDEFNATLTALEQLAERERDRSRPAPAEPPASPLEQYAKDLAAAQSRWIDAPAGWFR